MKSSIHATSALIFLSLSALASAQVVATIPGFGVTYPAGKIGGKSEIGIPDLYFSIPPANEYYLDYEVAFDSGWTWVKGGKLPGLVGGSHTSGCAAIVPSGWSARFMWRAGGQGEVYLYDQKRKNNCGDDYNFSSPGSFAIGAWNRITERVVINSPGKNDGLFEAWFNGVKKVTLPNLQLRGNVPVDSALVDLVSLETFFGGSSSSFAPPQTNHSRFNGFVVRKDLPDYSKPFQPITGPTSDLENPQQNGLRAAGSGNGYTVAYLGRGVMPALLAGGLATHVSLFDLKGRYLGMMTWNPTFGQWMGWSSIKRPSQPGMLLVKAEHGALTEKSTRNP